MVIIKSRDVFIPPSCRTCKINQIHLPPNLWDFTIYYNNMLLICELKSTKQKSIQYDNEKIIKKHQVKYLNKYKNYNGVMSGFIFNFANYDNFTAFLHIDDFNKYVENPTQKSIPLSYIKEHGIEIKNNIKKVKYHYYLDLLFNDIKKKYLA